MFPFWDILVGGNFPNNYAHILRIISRVAAARDNDPVIGVRFTRSITQLRFEGPHTGSQYAARRCDAGRPHGSGRVPESLWCIAPFYRGRHVVIGRGLLPCPAGCRKIG
jgi:hypothetical protein